MGGSESELPAAVLAVHQPATLQLLCHTVNVVRKIRLGPADIEDHYAGSAVHISQNHIRQLARELDSTMTEN